MNVICLSDTIGQIDQLELAVDKTKSFSIRTDRTTDVFAELKKLNCNKFANLAIAQHSDIAVRIGNIELCVYLGDLNINPNCDRLVKLCKEFNIENIDVIACNMFELWNRTFILLENYIESKLGRFVNIRASSDNTGNLKNGGNWIQESDNIDIRNLYFDETKIDNFNEVLASAIIISAASIAIYNAMAIAFKSISSTIVKYSTKKMIKYFAKETAGHLAKEAGKTVAKRVFKKGAKKAFGAASSAGMVMIFANITHQLYDDIEIYNNNLLRNNNLSLFTPQYYLFNPYSKNFDDIPNNIELTGTFEDQFKYILRQCIQYGYKNEHFVHNGHYNYDDCASNIKMINSGYMADGKLCYISGNQVNMTPNLTARAFMYKHKNNIKQFNTIYKKNKRKEETKILLTKNNNLYINDSNGEKKIDINVDRFIISNNSFTYVKENSLYLYNLFNNKKIFIKKSLIQWGKIIANMFGDTYFALSGTDAILYRVNGTNIEFTNVSNIFGMEYTAGLIFLDNTSIIIKVSTFSVIKLQDNIINIYISHDYVVTINDKHKIKIYEITYDGNIAHKDILPADKSWDNIYMTRTACLVSNNTTNELFAWGNIDGGGANDINKFSKQQNFIIKEIKTTMQSFVVSAKINNNDYILSWGKLDAPIKRPIIKNTKFRDIFQHQESFYINSKTYDELAFKMSNKSTSLAKDRTYDKKILKHDYGTLNINKFEWNLKVIKIVTTIYGWNALMSDGTLCSGGLKLSCYGETPLMPPLNRQLYNVRYHRRQNALNPKFDKMGDEFMTLLELFISDLVLQGIANFDFSVWTNNKIQIPESHIGFEKIQENDKLSKFKDLDGKNIKGSKDGLTIWQDGWWEKHAGECKWRDSWWVRSNSNTIFMSKLFSHLDGSIMGNAALAEQRKQAGTRVARAVSNNRYKNLVDSRRYNIDEERQEISQNSTIQWPPQRLIPELSIYDHYYSMPIISEYKLYNTTTFNKTIKDIYSNDHQCIIVYTDNTIDEYPKQNKDISKIHTRKTYNLGTHLYFINRGTAESDTHMQDNAQKYIRTYDHTDNSCQFKFKNTDIVPTSTTNNFAEKTFTNFSIQTLPNKEQFFKKATYNNVVFSNLTFDSLDLSGTDFGNTTMNNTKFNKCTLIDCNFNNVCGKKISFIECSMNGTQIGDNLLVYCEFNNCSDLIINFKDKGNVNISNSIFINVKQELDGFLYKTKKITCNCTNTEFDNLNLRGFDFTKAIVENTIFKNIGIRTYVEPNYHNKYNFESLTNSNFSFLNMKHVSFVNSFGKNINFSNAVLNYLKVDGCSFCQIRSVFFNNSSIRAYKYTDTIRTSEELTRAYKENVNYENCTIKDGAFNNSNIMLSNMKNTKLDRTKYTNCNLSGIDFTGSKGKNIIFDSCNFEIYSVGASLVLSKRACFDDVVFENCTFNNISFNAANCCVFKNSNFKNSVFSNIDMVNTTFVNCELQNSVFKNAIINNNLLKNCNIQGSSFDADCTFTNIANVNFTGCTFNSKLSNINISNTKFENTTFNTVNFTNSQIDNCNIQDAIFNGCIFTNTYSTNITGVPTIVAADMKVGNGTIVATSCDLHNLDLTDIDASNIDLVGSNMLGATVLRLITGKMTGPPSNYPTATKTEWTIHNKHIIGRNVYLKGCNFGNLDMSLLVLTGIKTDTNSTMNAPSALPSGWNYANGHLIGLNADISDGDLGTITLNDINFTGCDIDKCDMSGLTIGNSIVFWTNVRNAPIGYNTKIMKDWVSVGGNVLFGTNK